MLLDVTQKVILIVGGGNVALRKARGLIAAGARQISCVSPAFHPDTPAEVKKISANYQPIYLQNVDLVFAATDSPFVNDQIVSDANSRKIWVNRADASAEREGDFSTPAAALLGDLILTVSAGSSPALAALIRDQLNDKIDPAWIKMAAAMKSLRPRILENIPDIRQRTSCFKMLIQPQAFQVLTQQGVEGLWNWLEKQQTQGADPQ